MICERFSTHPLVITNQSAHKTQHLSTNSQRDKQTKRKGQNKMQATPEHPIHRRLRPESLTKEALEQEFLQECSPSFDPFAPTDSKQQSQPPSEGPILSALISTPETNLLQAKNRDAIGRNDRFDSTRTSVFKERSVSFASQPILVQPQEPKNHKAELMGSDAKQKAGADGSGVAKDESASKSDRDFRLAGSESKLETAAALVRWMRALRCLVDSCGGAASGQKKDEYVIAWVCGALLVNLYCNYASNRSWIEEEEERIENASSFLERYSVFFAYSFYFICFVFMSMISYVVGYIMGQKEEGDTFFSNAAGFSAKLKSAKLNRASAAQRDAVVWDHTKRLSCIKDQQVRDSIRSLIDLILRDFVTFWYKSVSPDDQEFPEETRALLDDFFGQLCQRAGSIDIISLLMKKVCDVLRQFLTEVQRVDRKARTHNFSFELMEMTEKEDILLESMSSTKSEVLHVAVMGNQSRQYFRLIAAYMTNELIHPDYKQSKALTALVREVLASNILGTVVTFFVPDYINMFLESLPEEPYRTQPNPAPNSNVTSLQSPRSTTMNGPHNPQPSLIDEPKSQSEKQQITTTQKATSSTAASEDHRKTIASPNGSPRLTSQPAQPKAPMPLPKRFTEIINDSVALDYFREYLGRRHQVNLTFLLSNRRLKESDCSPAELYGDIQQVYQQHFAIKAPRALLIPAHVRVEAVAIFKQSSPSRVTGRIFDNVEKEIINEFEKIFESFVRSDMFALLRANSRYMIIEESKEKGKALHKLQATDGCGEEEAETLRRGSFTTPVTRPRKAFSDSFPSTESEALSPAHNRTSVNLVTPSPLNRAGSEKLSDKKQPGSLGDFMSKRFSSSRKLTVEHIQPFSQPSVDAVEELPIYTDTKLPDFEQVSLNLSVHHAKIEDNEHERYVVYQIKVKKDTTSWSVDRRFSQFVSFHEKVKTLVPDFPGKLPSKWGLKQFDKEFVEKRRLGLDEYLRSLYGYLEITEASFFWEFLSPDNSSPDESHSKVIEVADAIQTDVVEKFRKTVTTIKSGATEMKDNIIKAIQPPTLFAIRDRDGSGVDSLDDSEDESFHDAMDEMSTQKVVSEKSADSNDPESYWERAVDDPNLTQPLFELIDEMFQLREHGWIRRQIMRAAKEVIDLSISGTINKLIVDGIRCQATGPSISEWIVWVRECVWPNGEFITPKPPRTEEEMRKTQETALSRLYHNIPPSAFRLFGKENTKRGSEQTFQYLQYPRLLQHLGYNLFDAILVALFPELEEKMTAFKEDLTKSQLKTEEEPKVSPVLPPS